MKILEAGIVAAVRMPVANIASKWKQDNIRRTNEAFDTGFPFVRICLKIFEGNGSQIAVSPAVGSQFPAIATGPFISITNDIIGMMLYMGITVLLS